jgi:hypothetical protein
MQYKGRDLALNFPLQSLFTLGHKRVVLGAVRFKLKQEDLRLEGQWQATYHLKHSTGISSAGQQPPFQNQAGPNPAQ